jgi:6-phospho-3-hexuloisomerase
MRDFEQSVVVITTDISTCLRSISPSQVQGALEAIDGAQRLYVAGVGRSGFAMRAFAMRLMHLGRRVHFVGDVTTPGIGEGDLLIIGSGSGSTESLQVMARKAKSLGAEVVLITIDASSPIAAVARHLIRIPAPSPKAADISGQVDSVQPMGSLFEQCLLLLSDIIILLLMDRQRISPEEMFARHANLE